MKRKISGIPEATGEPDCTLPGAFTHGGMSVHFAEPRLVAQAGTLLDLASLPPVLDRSLSDCRRVAAPAPEPASPFSAQRLLNLQRPVPYSREPVDIFAWR